MSESVVHMIRGERVGGPIAMFASTRPLAEGAREGPDGCRWEMGGMAKFEIESIGRVEAARKQAIDDDWGGSESSIVLDARFGEDALAGLETFSHVEVLFVFDRVDPAKIVTGARHPRNNPDWPAIGIFAQRGKNRPNRLGSTICRVVRREGLRLVVAELDAIDETPVVDLKPVMRAFLPRGEIRQPGWVDELMRDYWRRPDEPDPESGSG